MWIIKRLLFVVALIPLVIGLSSLLLIIGLSRVLEPPGWRNEDDGDGEITCKSEAPRIFERRGKYRKEGGRIQSQSERYASSRDKASRQGRQTGQPQAQPSQR